MFDLGRNRLPVFVLVWFLWLLVSASPVWSASLSVKAAVEKRTVTVGEPFIFQLQVEGSDTPDTPVLPDMDGFRVEQLGGQQNSSQYVSIVNGRVEKVVNRGYIFNYRLTAMRPGRYTIPAVTITAAGARAASFPLSITAVPPRKIDSLKLDMKLSKTECYVGEPIVLTLTWYLGEDVRNASLHLPFLDETERFFVDDPTDDPDPGAKYARVSTGSDEVVMKGGRGKLDNRTVTTYSLQKILIPLRAGEQAFRDVRAVCQVLTGYKQNRRSDRRKNRLFDDMFNDSFFSGRREVYESAVVPAPIVSLKVKPLPSKGRPTAFSGVVGSVNVDCAVSPREVKVGEPMTLTMKVSGMPYTKHIPSPDLNSLTPFTERFKIPREQAPGRADGAVMVFTQTIRPMSDSVTEIPPVEIVYFDVHREHYAVARSAAIPIAVESVRVVGLHDAEGGGPVSRHSQVKSRSGGIAHNYTGLDTLVDQSFEISRTLSDPQWLSVLFLPMLIYFGLWASRSYRERFVTDPALLRRRNAWKTYTRSTREAQTVLDNPQDFFQHLDRIFREFIGDSLDLSPGHHDPGVIVENLEKAGVPGKTCSRVRDVMDTLAAGCFGGMSGSLEGRKNLMKIVSECAGTIRKAVKN